MKPSGECYLVMLEALKPEDSDSGLHEVDGPVNKIMDTVTVIIVCNTIMGHILANKSSSINSKAKKINK